MNFTLPFCQERLYLDKMAYNKIIGENMKSTVFKISLLALVSSFAFAACSMTCPFSGDDKPSCSEGKCACGKECGHKMEEGKSCGDKEAGDEKKSCSHCKE